MLKKALAIAVATGALLVAGASVASAADDPGQEQEETCMTVIEFPLLLVDPPARAEFRVCQETANQGDGEGGDQPPAPMPPVPAPLG